MLSIFALGTITASASNEQGVFFKKESLGVKEFNDNLEQRIDPNNVIRMRRVHLQRIDNSGGFSKLVTVYNQASCRTYYEAQAVWHQYNQMYGEILYVTITTEPGCTVAFP